MKKFRSIYLDKLKEKDDKMRAQKAAKKNSFRGYDNRIIFG